MNFPQAVKYLESFVNYEKLASYPYKESHKLERIKGFLASIGDPQRDLKCIHVAGSKGKGSTCAFVTYILRRAGFRVGLYTSPHLSDFRERIRILYPAKLREPKRKDVFEGMISRKELIALVERLRPAISRYSKSSNYGALTFFEVYTALAFLYFKNKGVDFVVLETGLGGRLDATNTVESLVSVITPISYEHTHILGNTLRQIAREKAGIIKCHNVTTPSFDRLRTLRRRTLSEVEVPRHRLIVISAPQKKEAQNVIRNRCRKAQAELIEIKRPIQGLRLNLIGQHQRMNAAVASAAVRELKLGIKKSIIKEGLRDTAWPGRCEVVWQKPYIVLDGAQNSASAKVLKETIRGNFKYRRLILVLGVSSDKDIQGICQQLRGLANEVILTRSNNPRAAHPQDLAAFFRKQKAHLTKTVPQALALARRIAKKEDLVLFTGSLFVAGEARTLLCSGGPAGPDLSVKGRP